MPEPAKEQISGIHPKGREKEPTPEPEKEDKQVELPEYMNAPSSEEEAFSDKDTRAEEESAEQIAGEERISKDFSNP